MNHPKVNFDNDGKLRVLDQMTMKRSAALKDESNRFVLSKDLLHIEHMYLISTYATLLTHKLLISNNSKQRG